MDDAAYKIEVIVQEINDKITQGMRSRAYRAANELRNASQEVLRGKRSGREYIIPGTGRMTYYRRNTKNHKKGTATITYRRYRASAPGEPPANRFGHFRESWQPQTEITGSGNNLSVKSYIESSRRTDNGRYLLGQILEEGSPGGKIQPRPYREKIQKKALPKIKKIYQEPYT